MAKDNGEPYIPFGIYWKNKKMQLSKEELVKLLKTAREKIFDLESEIINLKIQNKY